MQVRGPLTNWVQSNTHVHRGKQHRETFPKQTISRWDWCTGPMRLKCVDLDMWCWLLMMSTASLGCLCSSKDEDWTLVERSQVNKSRQRLFGKGGEFASNKMVQYCTKNGIKRERRKFMVMGVRPPWTFSSSSVWNWCTLLSLCKLWKSIAFVTDPWQLSRYHGSCFVVFQCWSAFDNHTSSIFVQCENTVGFIFRVLLKAFDFNGKSELSMCIRWASIWWEMWQDCNCRLLNNLVYADHRRPSSRRALFEYLRGKALDVGPEYCKEAEDHLSKAVGFTNSSQEPNTSECPFD